MGLQGGQLVGFDIQKNFELTFLFNLSSSPITSIKFDPTHLIIAATEQSRELYAISLITKEVNYVYLDLGRKQFCTVALEH